MADRHVVHIGGGKYCVIAGRKLNDAPVSRAEADRLAKGLPPAAAPATARPMPDQRPERWHNAGGSAGFTIKGGPSW
jgi:hypothetical protein